MSDPHQTYEDVVEIAQEIVEDQGGDVNEIVTEVLEEYYGET